MTLTIDPREITGPGAGTHPAGGRSSFRRILVPVRSPAASSPALAVAARICAMTAGALRLVHVRTCNPPGRTAARFYRQTPGEAAAVLEEALLAVWARGGPRATTAMIDARRGDVATAIAWQAPAWPADLIVLARPPRLAVPRLALGSVPDQVMRKASCPVLAVPARQPRPPLPALGHKLATSGQPPMSSSPGAHHRRRRHSRLADRPDRGRGHAVRRHRGGAPGPGTDGAKAAYHHRRKSAPARGRSESALPAILRSKKERYRVKRTPGHC